MTVQRTGDGSGPRLGLLLRDRFGLTYQMPMVRLPDSGDATAAFNIGALVDAPVGSAAPPLSIAGVLVSHNTSSGNAGQLAVRGISVARDGSGPAVPLRVTAPAWTLSAPARSGSGASPNGILLPDDQDRQDASGGAPPLLRLGYNGGAGSEVAVTTGGAGAADVPGIATHAYLDAVDAKVGDVVPVTLAGTSVPVRITAAVGSLPAAGDTAVAVDAATAGRLLAARGGLELPPPDEWWLPAASAHDRAPAEAAAELRAGARTQRVELREEVAAGLLDDPLSAGPQAALAALALACAVLAAIGFAASAAAAARERGPRVRHPAGARGAPAGPGPDGRRRERCAGRSRGRGRAGTGRGHRALGGPAGGADPRRAPSGAGGTGGPAGRGNVTADRRHRRGTAAVGGARQHEEQERHEHSRPAAARGGDVTTPPPGPPPGTVPPPGPVPPRRTRPTPWVRTRLRATPTASLLAAALAFVAVLHGRRPAARPGPGRRPRPCATT
ncbi:hypothetical protein GCM10020254_73010 [Streptomyces goshikiensis]